MPFVAAVTFVMYQKVHLLLDDITVIAAEGDERCLRGPRMHRTLFHFSELHNSHFLHGNLLCSPHKLNQKKRTDTGGGPETKDYNLEWPK